MKGYMTTQEAAKYLGYRFEYISYLCAKGKMQGAERAGKWVWLIPEQSVYEYNPGPKGFAIDKARRDAEREAQRERINAAIRQGKALKQAETAAQKTEADRA